MLHHIPPGAWLSGPSFAIRSSNRARAEDLKGGDKVRNLEIANAVLDGAPGPARDIVLVNSAAALVAGGKADTFLEGMAIAAVSIDTGAARAKVAELARFKG
jgi:anthranilate phosphoribosyltransferase